MTERPIPKDPTYTINVRSSGIYSRPYSELDDGILACSDPSFDRWTNVVHLIVDNVSITRPILQSMTSLLDLPFAKDPSGNGDKEYRWIRVTFNDSVFADRDNLPSYADEQGYLTIRDILEFFYTLARRALRISINNSSSIVSYFLRTDDYVSFRSDALEIVQRDELSDTQCFSLGGILRRSVDLKSLVLHMPFEDEVHELFQGFADLVNLRELSLFDDWDRQVPMHELADLLVRDWDKASDGPIMRLLQNPLNQLRKLSLSKMSLKDHHLSVILQMMPTCQIEDFTFSYNFIQVQGMQEFANLLPRMPALKYVDFRCNAWTKAPCTDDDRRMVGAALLQGLMENTRIETMHGIDSTPQALLLWHYVAMNRAGRRILTSSQPIPDGLLPLVLVRAWKAMSFANGDAIACDMEDRCPKLGGANAVYYFLRNCPRILSFCS